MGAAPAGHLFARGRELAKWKEKCRPLGTLPGSRNWKGDMGLAACGRSAHWPPNWPPDKQEGPPEALCLAFQLLFAAATAN